MPAASSPAPTQQFASASWTALGCHVEVLVTEAGDLAVARAAVERVLDDVDRTLSRFREDSELSGLNRDPAPSVPVSPLLARALRVAIDAAEWTGGAVDPTIGTHLLDLGYDRTFSAVAATGPTLVRRVHSTTTHRALTLEDGAGSRPAMLHRTPGVRLDLGATGKGFAADLAADAAVTAGARSVLVNLGGDISVAGEAPADGWPVLVTDRAAPAADHRDAPGSDEVGGPEQTIALWSGGLATSGTSRRRWRRGGVQLHHIVDPATGTSAAGPWRTVSVAAPTCVLANAAATAAIVRGASAPAWLTTTGLAARLVSHTGRVERLGSWP